MGTAWLDRQPIAAAVLSSGQVVARDWKSGDVLLGRLAR
jgi:hypothetical protein